MGDGALESWCHKLSNASSLVSKKYLGHKLEQKEISVNFLPASSKWVQDRLNLHMELQDPWNLQKCDFFGSAASLWYKKTIEKFMRKTCQNFARYLEKSWFCLSYPWFLLILELFPRRYELSNRLISNKNQGFERQNHDFSRYLEKFWHVGLEKFSMSFYDHKVVIYRKCTDSESFMNPGAPWVGSACPGPTYPRDVTR